MQIRFYALCLAAPWCLCALHMYERIRECSGARVCLGCATNLPAAIYIWVYVSVCVAVCVHLSVCVRVFDGDHARSAAALSNREHVRESSRESATKESIGTKRRFFFFFFVRFSLSLNFFPLHLSWLFLYSVSNIEYQGSLTISNMTTHDWQPGAAAAAAANRRIFIIFAFGHRWRHIRFSGVDCGQTV